MAFRRKTETATPGTLHVGHFPFIAMKWKVDIVIGHLLAMKKTNESDQISSPVNAFKGTLSESSSLVFLINQLLQALNRHA